MLFTSCNVPQIDSISTNTLAYDTILTINGSGFSLNQCENTIYIDQVECKQEDQPTSNTLTCQLGMNSGLLPNQFYTLEVLVKNKGYALHQNGFYQVSFQSVITIITPDQGSVAGGTLITIEGDGFAPNSFVILDLSLYSNAQLLSSTNNRIQLLTNLDQPGKFPILVSSNGEYAQCAYVNGCNFTFSSAATPTLTSITPSSLTQLNTIFTLVGTNFGSNETAAHVFIGEQICYVLSIQSESLTCLLQELPLGSQYVTVLVDGLCFQNE